MKKFTIILVLLLIIAGGYYFYDKSNKQVKVPENIIDGQYNSDGTELIPKPSESKNNDEPQVAMPSPSPTLGNVIEGTFSSGDENGQAADVQVVEVVYDGVAFNPATINIKANDWVFFKNNSNANFWPASSQHPTHTDYPEFDAKSPVAPGKSFKFQFEKVGSWKFHDHLNETAFGVVNVK